jgi:hypothetical protein
MPTNHPIRSTAAITLAIAGICAPAATARVAPPDPPQAPQTSHNPSPAVRDTSPNRGFDWGDAGIGAAGGLALSMLGIGGTLVISSQRRTRHPHRAPAQSAS